MSQKLAEIYNARPVQAAAASCGMDSTRRLALFHMILAGVKYLEIATIGKGNWADAFSQDRKMSLLNLNDSPFAVVIEFMFETSIAQNKIRGISISDAVSLGFYAQPPEEAEYLLAMWKEAIRISRTSLGLGRPGLAQANPTATAALVA